MGVIYQLTFFLALGLLAIVITIFVFAVSLLGRAMEAAAKSEREKLAERKEDNARAMAAIKEEIEKAEGQIPKGLIRKLKRLEKRDRRFERELAKIRKAPELLTVKGGIVPTAASLLGVLILSGGAWYLSNIPIFIGIIPVLIWVLGLVAIVYSILRICQCLRVIEGVAITSEEAALKRTIDAFKIAQKELEEERKPELELYFKKAPPPFQMKAESEMVIKFSVGISRGDIARNASVVFWAPSGFEFPGSVAQLPTTYKKYASYVSTKIELEDIIRPIITNRQVKLKAPPQPQRYQIAYKLYCEGFFSEFEEFEIVVEELEPEDIPF